MIAGSVAKRYAKALVEAAAAGGELLEVGEELQVLASFLKDNPEIQAFFGNPSIRLSEKRALLGQVLERSGVSPLTADFLQLVLEKGRLSQLEIICRLYRDLVDERLGRVRATVTTASPLSEDAQESLTKRLSDIMKKEVYLVLRQDPSLLGGMVTQLGDSIVFDGSLKRQLERLKEQLIKG